MKQGEYLICGLGWNLKFINMSQKLLERNNIQYKKHYSLEDLNTIAPFRHLVGGILTPDCKYWVYDGSKWIGKRAVQTKNLRSCWIEDVSKYDTKKDIDSIVHYLCGKDADYTEIFYKDKWA